jgi:hypothetical protein
VRKRARSGTGRSLVCRPGVRPVRRRSAIRDVQRDSASDTYQRGEAMPVATADQYAEMLDRAVAGRFAFPAVNVTRLCPNACPIDPRPSSARSWTSPGWTRARAWSRGASARRTDRRLQSARGMRGCGGRRCAAARSGACRRGPTSSPRTGMRFGSGLHPPRPGEPGRRATRESACRARPARLVRSSGRRQSRSG